MYSSPINKRNSLSKSVRRAFCWEKKKREKEEKEREDEKTGRDDDKQKEVGQLRIKKQNGKVFYLLKQESFCLYYNFNSVV